MRTGVEVRVGDARMCVVSGMLNKVGKGVEDGRYE